MAEIECRHAAKAGRFLFKKQKCAKADYKNSTDKRWTPTDLICKTCRTSVLEAIHDCAYFDVSITKEHTNQPDVAVIPHCLRQSPTKESWNIIKDLSKCFPDCKDPEGKPAYRKRPISEPSKPVPHHGQTTPIKVPLLKDFISKIFKFIRGIGGLVIDLINAFPLIIKVLVIVIILLFFYGSLLSHVFNPQKIESLLRDAERSFRFGSYEESIEGYNKVLKLEPNNREALEGLGKIRVRLLQEAENLYNSGNYKESIKGYVKVLKLEPNNQDALKGLDKVRIRLVLQKADNLLNSGSYEEAIERYNRVLESDPNNKKALEGLRNSRISMRSQEANDLNRHETVRQALDGGRNCFDDRNYGCAGRMFNVVLNADHTNNEAIEGRRNSIRLLLQEADRLYNDGNYDMAKKAYEDVLTIDPDNGSAKEGINRLSIRWMLQEANKHNSLGNYKDAIEWYNKVLSNDPHNQAALEGLHKANISLGSQEPDNFSKSDNLAASNLIASDTQLKEKEQKSIVLIETDKGEIVFEMYPDVAPNTVARITELVKQDFYNGLTFHRVVPGFVIQGGDPKGDGTGGSGKKLPAEFNNKKHVLGTVAMARAKDPNSADSQFYICLSEQPHLDGNYTVFGQVVKGIDVVHKIAKGDVMNRVTLK